MNGPSIWKLANGVLQQKSRISGAASPEKPGTYVVTGDPGWSDYRLSVRLRSDSDGTFGVMFRFVDADNYYRLSLDPKMANCQLIKKHNGNVSSLRKKSYSYQVGEPIKIDVDVVGSRFVCYLNGELLFKATDKIHPSGCVGLYCSENDSIHFEWVEMRQPSIDAYALLQDHFAEGDKSDWAFIDEGKFGKSKWAIANGILCQTKSVYSPPVGKHDVSELGTYAVAGDPNWKDVIIQARLRSAKTGAIGLMFRYKDAQNYYRFSIKGGRNICNLVKRTAGSFLELWSDDELEFESNHSYKVTIICVGTEMRGYLDDVPMFVINDADINTGAVALYGSNNGDMQFSQVRVYPIEFRFCCWLLDEPFDSQIPGRWTFTDDGSKKGPSHWEIQKGELQQTSYINDVIYINEEEAAKFRIALASGDVTWKGYQKYGTYAVAGEGTLSDYRLSVGVRSDDPRAIGVMFRYVDNDNYYRFSMDSLIGYRLLIKKVKGVVTRLWFGFGKEVSGYWPGRSYMLTIDCIGNELIGYINGTRVFACKDNDLPNGRIGLYCWANPGARFFDVRVAPFDWEPYYTFVREGLLPAGTRVRVFAGNELYAPSLPADPGVIRRFIASLKETGEIRLPARGTDLRLVDPAGKVGHTRRFLQESSYDPIKPTILRKADGTGFFLLMPSNSPAGSMFEKGQYRLRLKYLRNNLDILPDCQVLKQAGDDSPEQVVIDIPA
jgi:hypothetical protein